MGKKKKKDKAGSVKKVDTPPVVEPRARISQAERKQRNLALRWTPQDRSWMKHARCFLCRKLFCVNNYADRQVRIPRRKGHPICGWCDNRPSTDFLITAVEFYYAKGKGKVIKAHQELKAGSYTGMGK